jgi:CMP-N,N'-diacetyllegionaminic acid synthase
MKICAIIPARGGSKGIPRKNLIEFAGKPLLTWSIEQARSSRFIDATYVTSDSQEIREVARRSGAGTIQRPHEISGDRATSESALRHALEILSTNFDYVVFLQATSPLRRIYDIDNAVRRIQDDDSDSLFSASKLVDFNLWEARDGSLKSVNYDYKNRKPRQECTNELWIENGSIYVFKPDILYTYDNRLGGRISLYEMELWQAFEIDEPDDIPLCETFFRQHRLDLVSNGADNDVKPV